MRALSSMLASVVQNDTGSAGGATRTALAEILRVGLVREF